MSNQVSDDFSDLIDFDESMDDVGIEDDCSSIRMMASNSMIPPRALCTEELKTLFVVEKNNRSK